MVVSAYRATSCSVGFSEVELIEDPPTGAGRGAGRAVDPPGAVRTRGPRAPDETRRGAHHAVLRRRRSHVLATTLLLVVVLSNVVQVLENRVRRAVLAEMTGALAPVAGPVAPRWSAEVALWPDVIGAAGLLVAVETVGTGAFGVVALDPRDGSVVWRARGSESPDGGVIQGCHAPSSGLADAVGLHRDEGRPVVITCAVRHRGAARLDNRRPGGSVLLDARTGETLGTEPAAQAGGGLAGGPGPRVPIDDGSLTGVTVQLTPDGGLAGIDARSSSVLWVHDAGPGRASAAVLRARVLVGVTDAVVCLDGRTGAALWSVPAVTRAAAVLTDGDVLLAPQHDTERGAVLSAVDVETGVVMWVSDIPEGLDLFVVDGLLYGASADRLVALG